MSNLGQWAAKQSTKWILAFVLFAVAGGVVVYRMFSTETLEHAARKFDECLLDKDTGCMYDYMHPDEVALLGMSEADFDEFMHSYFYLQLEDFSTSGDVKLELKDTKTQLYITSSRVYRHPDGREFPLSFEVHMDDERPRVISALTNLAVMTCYSDRDPGEPLPSGVDKFKFLIQCYNKHIPTWAAANIHGYTVKVRESRNTADYFRFDDSIERMTRAIERVESEE